MVVSCIDGFQSFNPIVSPTLPRCHNFFFSIPSVPRHNRHIRIEGHSRLWLFKTTDFALFYFFPLYSTSSSTILFLLLLLLSPAQLAKTPTKWKVLSCISIFRSYFSVSSLFTVMCFVSFYMHRKVFSKKFL
jgi:hypothetical protein